MHMILQTPLKLGHEQPIQVALLDYPTTPWSQLFSVPPGLTRLVAFQAQAVSAGHMKINNTNKSAQGPHHSLCPLLTIGRSFIVRRLFLVSDDVVDPLSSADYSMALWTANGQSTMQIGETATITAIAQYQTDTQDTQQITAIHLHCVGIVLHRHCAGGAASLLDSAFTDKLSHATLQVWRRVAASDNPLALVCHSFCPAVAGQCLIKAALVLCLLGGANANAPMKLSESRCGLHALLLGDSKTDSAITFPLLNAALQTAPNSHVVDGSLCSDIADRYKQAGIFKGRDGLTAGLLPRADRGALIIQQLQLVKMGDRCLIQTAMDHQCVYQQGKRTPCRVSVLASVSARDDRLDPMATVGHNLFKQLTPAQAASFDLVYRIAESRSAEIDDKTARAVIHNYQRNARVHASPAATASVRTAMTPMARSNSSQSPCIDASPLVAHSPRTSASDATEAAAIVRTTAAAAATTGRGRQPLHVRVAAPCGPLLSLEELQLLFAYAKRFIEPTLDIEAVKAIQGFLIELERVAALSPGLADRGLTRHLATLTRLTEARARLEGRTRATVGDALDAIDLFKEGHSDWFSDSLHTVDFRKSQDGAVKSKAKRIGALKAALESRSAQHGADGWTMEALEDLCALCRLGMNKGEIQELIEEMNQAGIFIKRGTIYQFVK